MISGVLDLGAAGKGKVMATEVSGEVSVVPPTAAAVAARPRLAEGAAFSIVLALGFSHFLNDTIQSLVPSLYPLIKENYGLSFAQIGIITLTQQIVSSLLQPCVGLVADHRPQPYSLAVGMCATLVGLLLLASADHYSVLLLAAALIGAGSAVFHPEASRVARLASGGRHGLAQSLFQVGGNLGSASGPIIAAFIIMRKGQGSVGWFSSLALLAMVVLVLVGNWYRRERALPRRIRQHAEQKPDLSRSRVFWALVILLSLVFSKAFYQASLSTYYTFYLMDKFQLSKASAQIYLFIFLAAVALGTLVGGPIGDRFGRKAVIWGSILGAIPFALMLPHASLFWTAVLTVAVGATMASASSAIIVYALDLVPGKIGTMAGLFFGLSFGMAGIGAAALGGLADATNVGTVYQVCAYLPLIGLLTVFLPNLNRAGRTSAT
ncbi:MAG TPA: MFS transporter [Stellaceae bacterium]|nr:MFS transporter [Stellaceae bacterium]